MLPRGRVRLDRAISKLGLASRREARTLVEEGRVTVDGRACTDPSLPVVPERARIEIDGVAAAKDRWRTIALHKPRGVVTTRSDPEGRPTVFDVLGPAGEGLVAVGRLDLASSGLLLLTNDTHLADALTDPRSAVRRRYIVTARGEVSDESARRMEAGIGELRARSVEIRKRSRRESLVVIELTTGRNREIRRLLEACGHEVSRLLRVAFGPVELGSLQPGDWRELDPSLFASQRQHRIDRRRPARGQVAGDERDQGQERRGARQGRRVDR